MLKQAVTKTFEEYSHNIFILYLINKFQTASHLDLVWHSSFADSLKRCARAKHGRGMRRHLVAKAAIPGNWQNFLREDANKNPS
jgi:hypothetical protein